MNKKMLTLLKALQNSNWAYIIAREIETSFEDMRENIEDSSQKSYSSNYWALLEYLREGGITTRDDLDELENLITWDQIPEREISERGDEVYGHIVLYNERDGSLKWDLDVIKIPVQLKYSESIRYGVTERGDSLKYTLFSYEYGEGKSLSPLATTPGAAIRQFLDMQNLLLNNL